MTKLLLDAMLIRLARRLRVLGYDCAVLEPDGRSEKRKLEEARRSGRRLITASRRLAAIAPDEILRVPPEGLAEQVRATTERFPIEFDRLAFRRCSRDNALLEEVPFETVEGELPPLIREQRPDPVRRCPECGRLYWPGTHTRRMAREFERWTGRRLENFDGEKD